MKIITKLFLVLLLLTGCTNKVSWGERYFQLLNSNEESKNKYYEELRKELSDIRVESKATYVYVLMPIKDSKASIDGDVEGAYMLTIDGSEVTEDWGVTYDYEVQFKEAWLGEISAARSAWTDGDSFNWSAFAPIYNKEGKVVAILGVDYPAKDVIDLYPEWNRDGDKWNGYKDEIKEAIPAEIQAKIDEVKAIAEKYATKLSK